MKHRRQLDTDFWDHRQKNAPKPNLAVSDNPKVGELLDHRGRKVSVVRARPARPFGFAPGQTREGD